MQEQIRFYESVGFETMKREICAYYLKTAAWYASRVRNELNNYKRAAQIRSDMRNLIRENPLESLPLTDEERENIRKAFHPLREQILRLPRVMLQILGDGGVKELVRRIARKFGKY